LLSRSFPWFDSVVTALSLVVQDYVAHHRDDERVELDYFRRRGRLEEAVSDAALARLHGKKLSHQWRLREHVLAESRDRLLQNVPRLVAAQTSDDLHDTVEAIIGPITGVGPLMIYDTALRIGAHRGLLPTKVYIHAGTQVGARNLGLPWQARTLEVEALPPVLRALPPHEVEDLLCIYKDVFATETSGAAFGARCGPRTARCAPSSVPPAFRARRRGCGG
jgi:hypothetical protein